MEAWPEGKKSVTKAELQEFIAGSMLQIKAEAPDNKGRSMITIAKVSQHISR